MTTTTLTRRSLSGMSAFFLVWLGQLVSILSTQMTQFALTIWVYERTGSATQLGLTGVFAAIPFLIVSPIAGVMVDRYNRKLMMMLSDLGAGAVTLALLSLQAIGILQVWHLYVASALTSIFACFQWPAYSAAISLMIPKEQLGRANGMISLMESAPHVLSPLLAGALFGLIGLTGLLTLDVATFLLAIAVLLIVYIPQPPVTEEGRKATGNLLQQSLFGFRYIGERPSLLGLQLVFLAGNFFGSFFYVLLAPMILSSTANNEVSYGLVQSAGALGMVAGGVIMSLWGGTKRRVHGVLFGHILVGLFAQVLFALSGRLEGWLAMMFLGQLVVPWINGSNQAIWQSKVAPDLQGRVFATRRLIAWSAGPIVPLIAGPLADFVLEPAMRDPSSRLAQSFGWLVGVGPGSGIALITVFVGIAVMMVGVVGYLLPVVREAETRLPDHAAK